MPQVLFVLELFRAAKPQESYFDLYFTFWLILFFLSAAFNDDKTITFSDSWDVADVVTVSLEKPLCFWVQCGRGRVCLTDSELIEVCLRPLQRGPTTSSTPKPWMPFATGPSVSTSPPTLKAWAMATVWSFTARWVCAQLHNYIL